MKSEHNDHSYQISGLIITRDIWMLTVTSLLLPTTSRSCQDDEKKLLDVNYVPQMYSKRLPILSFKCIYTIE